MSAVLQVVNYCAVGAFGCLLSAAFCGMMGKSAKRRTARDGWTVAVITSVILAAQLALWLAFGAEKVRAWYPLTTHAPLFLCLWAYQKKPVRAFIAVMTAYLCCQLRHWCALAAVALIRGGATALCVAELVLTMPLLVLLVRFVAPPIVRMTEHPSPERILLLLMPSIFYTFDYAATVYTDWLYSGVAAVVEFMPFLCCAAFILYVLLTERQEKARLAIEEDRNNLRLQVAQSVRQLAALREAERQTAQYRHDLRHHLRFIASCIETGDDAKAQDYIRTIDDSIAAEKLAVFCENEEVNLILSSYAARAAAEGIVTDFRVSIPQETGISTEDLCVLLGNAMENACNACTTLPVGEERRIEVRAYERGKRLMIQISNTCVPCAVCFEKGLPVAEKEGHGMGVRSIKAVAERCKGLCDFALEGDRFVLRVSL